MTTDAVPVRNYRYAWMKRAYEHLKAQLRRTGPLDGPVPQITLYNFTDYLPPAEREAYEHGAPPPEGA